MIPSLPLFLLRKSYQSSFWEISENKNSLPIFRFKDYWKKHYFKKPKFQAFLSELVLAHISQYVLIFYFWNLGFFSDKFVRNFCALWWPLRSHYFENLSINVHWKWMKLIVFEQIQGFGYGMINVCYSRVNERPNGNSTSAYANDMVCRQINTDSHVIEIGEPCSDYDRAIQCPPLFISVATGRPTIQQTFRCNGKYSTQRNARWPSRRETA